MNTIASPLSQPQKGPDPQVQRSLRTWTRKDGRSELKEVEKMLHKVTKGKQEVEAAVGR